MTAFSTKNFALVASIVLLAGCKTPQAALDQANNGAALTVSLQAQLAQLRTTQANIAKLRIERIRRANAMVAENNSSSAFDERIASVAGNNAEAQLVSDLRGLADSRAKDQKDLDDALASLDANMNSLLETVPFASTKLGAVQQSMAALGAELSLEKRAQVIASFASDLKKAIDKNQAKSDVAVANAPNPPEQDPLAVGTK